MLTTIGILLVGIIVVIGGVLVLRLHAFLALILGAILVAVLTPASSVEQYALESESFKIVPYSKRVADPQGQVMLKFTKKEQWLQPGMICLVLRPTSEGNGFSQIAELEVNQVFEVERGKKKEKRATATLGTNREQIQLQPDDFVVTPAARKSASDLAKQTIGRRVADGFGSTCAKIGILIAMASIIGKCLLDSGAAD